MRRFVGVLVSVLLVSGLLITAPNATPVATAASISKLTIVPAAPMHGERFTVTGRLSTQVVRKVQLQRWTSGGWKKVTNARTDATGAFGFTTSTRAKAVTLRVVAAKVKVAGVKYRRLVAKKVKVVTVTQQVRLSMPSQAYVNTDLSATVSFSPARPGRPVQLQAKPADGDWGTVATGEQAADGTAGLAFLVTVPGSYSYRALGPAWHGAAAITSGGVEVTVGWDASAVPGSGAAPSISAGFLGSAILGQPYLGTVYLNGGSQPFNWTATGLPEGLSLAAAFSYATISGTPTAAGAYPVTIKVTDGAGRTAEKSFTLQVA